MGLECTWCSCHSPGTVSGNFIARRVPELVPAKSIRPERDITHCVKTMSLAGTSRRICWKQTRFAFRLKVGSFLLVFCCCCCCYCSLFVCCFFFSIWQSTWLIDQTYTKSSQQRPAIFMPTRSWSIRFTLNETTLQRSLNFVPRGGVPLCREVQLERP